MKKIVNSITYSDITKYWNQSSQVPLLHAGQHSFWQASSVFDGARYYQECAPDLMKHCERVVESARIMQLKPKQSPKEIFDLCVDGIKQFPKKAELYIKPVFYNTNEVMSILPDPKYTHFAIQIMEEKFPEYSEACFQAIVTPQYRRPDPATAPTQAKAGCLYPIAQLAKQFAKNCGYNMAVMLNLEGHVAEFASSNLFMVKNGIYYTPKIDGTFLNGITRQRLIHLLKENNKPIVEKVILPEELLTADEVFSTGNHSKIAFCTKVVYNNKSSQIVEDFKTLEAYNLYRAWAWEQKLA